MPTPYREATYLLRRRGVWYFRFRIPAEIQSAVGRTELRLSLATSELTVARTRAGALLPYVYAIKRLRLVMDQLDSNTAQEILDRLFTAFVGSLARTREPWLQPETANGRDHEDDRRKRVKRQLREGDIRPWADTAAEALARRDIAVDERDPTFIAICLGIGKLEAFYFESLRARKSGDYQREEAFIRDYQARGCRLLTAPEAEPRSADGPPLTPAPAKSWLAPVSPETTGQNRLPGQRACTSAGPADRRVAPRAAQHDVCFRAESYRARPTR